MLFKKFVIKKLLCYGVGMKTIDVDKEIDYITRQIVQKYDPKKIILFGSAARGSFNKDSDVDLFIIKDDLRPGGDRISAVSAMFDHNIATDILVYTTAEVEQCLKWGDPFVREILSNGTVLYG